MAGYLPIIRRRFIFLAAAAVCWIAPSVALGNDYEAAVSKWTSHRDVGEWLKKNFKFDKDRQQIIQSRLVAHGPEGLLARNPATLFNSKTGYCGDAANFALDALNRINPEHDARWVFIENGKGKPNHWVTGFAVDGKLYVMDYGAGHGWEDMKGIHGPYDSLDEYRDFLSSLRIKRFSVGQVMWREMPGQSD